MSLNEFLHRSNSSEQFRQAIADFASSGRPNEWIKFDGRTPPVKVERALTKLLEAHPDLEIESVTIDATSGCEYFRGELQVRTPGDERLVHFDWDCKWRAEQEGWQDYFGFPDQIRAAREFGYDCFRSWTEERQPRTA